ncbi:hypothetical protein [Bradyrhizobium sp. 195]|uniref:hypothetical protein n=1 Tax=Bradyrhizobium sp. 195 TaxID=2782662 RepID=UPI00200117E8|nr:hypothetical protein [Bradyrhizobium sp. 195]
MNAGPNAIATVPAVEQPVTGVSEVSSHRGFTKKLRAGDVVFVVEPDFSAPDREGGARDSIRRALRLTERQPIRLKLVGDNGNDFAWDRSRSQPAAETRVLHHASLLARWKILTLFQ